MPNRPVVPVDQVRLTDEQRARHANALAQAIVPLFKELNVPNLKPFELRVVVTLTGDLGMLLHQIRIAAAVAVASSDADSTSH